MAITGYDYDYAGSGQITAVNIPGIAADNTFTGTQSFSGTINSSSTTTGTVKISGGLGVTQGIVANAVWGAAWNDLADLIVVPSYTKLEPGYAYCFNGTDYYKSPEYLASNFIGIHSDTAGFRMGYQENKKQLCVGVAGFILAYIDKEYSTGTPLTVTESGYLTEMKAEDLLKYPHRMVGTFWKKETAKKWGPKDQEIDVNGRMWIKVR